MCCNFDDTTLALLLRCISTLAVAEACVAVRDELIRELTCADEDEGAVLPWSFMVLCVAAAEMAATSNACSGGVERADGDVDERAALDGRRRRCACADALCGRRSEVEITAPATGTHSMRETAGEDAVNKSSSGVPRGGGDGVRCRCGCDGLKSSSSSVLFDILVFEVDLEADAGGDNFVDGEKEEDDF